MCSAGPVWEGAGGRIRAVRPRSPSTMFRLFTLLTLFLLANGATAWDLAVAVGSRLELGTLLSNGSLRSDASVGLDEAFRVTALALSGAGDAFFLGDARPGQTAALYRVPLSGAGVDSRTRQLLQESSRVSEDYQSRILGIAHDHVSNSVFWSNGAGGEILSLNLGHPDNIPRVLHRFTNRSTTGLALDSCSRTLFWTTANLDGGYGYIEASEVDGRDHRILFHDIHNPTDITVDQKSQKIYWCDDGEGIYFTIERSNLDGSLRSVVLKGINHKPTSLTLVGNYVYWTDVDHRVVWRIEKTATDGSDAPMFNVRTYAPGVPRVVVSWENSVAIDCSAKFIQRNRAGSNQNIFQSDASSTEIDLPEIKKLGPEKYNEGSRTSVIQHKCLNSGTVDTDSGQCKCIRGYRGALCEIPTCYNYCVNGICYVDSQGYAQCQCYPGYNGARCERDVCSNFCLNGGRCSVGQQGEPACACAGDFQGRHCEVHCSQYCQQSELFISADSGVPPLCSCTPGGLYHVVTAENVSLNQQQLVSYRVPGSSIEMPLIISLSVVGVVCLIFIILSAVLFKKVLKLRKRPRIKRRIIVNKNVTPTPLTSRPSPTADQCEITIENCCNMNICETPCYEPQLRTSGKTTPKTEEKKNLLGNMEDGESCSPCPDSSY